MSISRHLALAILLASAQAMFAAHASVFAGKADHDHERHACQICILADRTDDALPSVQKCCAASADFAPHSSAFAKDVVSKKIIRSPESRAPPLHLSTH